MTEGPVVVMVLERDNAIKHWRDVMGATNPEKAAEGTDSQEVRQEHRTQCRAWIGRAGNRGGRDSVLLQHGGTAVAHGAP